MTKMTGALFVPACVMDKIMSSLVAQRVKNLPTMWETRVPSLGWEVLMEKEWLPTPVFLSGKSHRQRSLVGYSLWSRKELDMAEQ